MILTLKLSLPNFFGKTPPKHESSSACSLPNVNPAQSLQFLHGIQVTDSVQCARHSDVHVNTKINVLTSKIELDSPELLALYELSCKLDVSASCMRVHIHLAMQLQPIGPSHKP